MTKTLALTLALLAAASCKSDKIGGPSGPVEAVSLDFCSFFRPTWMAIQNEGEQWKAVNVPATGPITFDATEKVSVAMVLSFFGNLTFVTNTTRAEMQGNPISVGCAEFNFGDRELNGTVSGLAADQLALISAAFTASSATNDGSWLLEGLPTTPVDLVATRVADVFSQTADRVIVRRAITPGAPGSAPIATLNFAATEALPPESATLTISGAGIDFVDVSSTFMTANGTSHLLTSVSGSGSSFNFLSVPAALRTGTDIHQLLSSMPDDGGSREVINYYKAPANKTFTFGPMIGTPTISTVATSPVKRMRAQVAAQTYGTGASVSFNQVEFCGEGFCDFRVVGVFTSAGFLGGAPATWDLTIPDMSAAGYQAAWGLQNTAVAVEYDVIAYGGAPGVFAGTPVDGATIISSTRSSSTSGMMNTARSGPVKRAALRPFGPFAMPGRR